MEPTAITNTINDEQREFLRLKAERNARRAEVMADKWKDPLFRDKTLVAMKEARGNARWRARMRKEKMQQAYTRAEHTGVLPHWTPKRVRATEPTGEKFTYDSIRQCGVHYGIKETNMRAILKYGRAWNGITFVLE